MDDLSIDSLPQADKPATGGSSEALRNRTRAASPDGLRDLRPAPRWMCSGRRPDRWWRGGSDPWGARPTP